MKAWVTYTGQKPGTKFQFKDEKIDLHKNDLLYYSKCPEPTCNEGYLGEAGRSIIERSSDDCGKDKQWHLICHALNNNCWRFLIIDSSYHNNRFKRKISEAWYIKQYERSSITQEQSVQVKFLAKFFSKYTLPSIIVNILTLSFL